MKKGTTWFLCVTLYLWRHT